MLGNLSCNSLATVIVNFATQVRRKIKINSISLNAATKALRDMFIFGVQRRAGQEGVVTRRLPTTCLAQQNCKTRVRRILKSCYHGSKFLDLKRRRETCQLQNLVFMIYLLRK